MNEENKEQPIRVTKYQLTIEALDGNGLEDLNLEYYKKRVEIYAELTGAKYWTILHDKDIYNEEDAPSLEKVGKPKRKHFHLVVDFPSKKTKSSVIERLSNVLKIAPNRISCRECETLSYAVKYLTHKTLLAISLEKHRYNEDEVITNDRATYNGLCAVKGEEISIDTLLTLCRNCHYNTIRIMRALGTTNYQRYRLIIQDICKDDYGDISTEKRFVREFLKNNEKDFKALDNHLAINFLSDADLELLKTCLACLRACAD